MRRLLLLSLLTVSCVTSQPPAIRRAGAVPVTPVPTRVWTQARPVVLRHATVMPASGPTLEDGAVSFAEGKLIAVGRNADVPTPPGAEEVDATGLYVTPGLIDVHSHDGVSASPSSFGTDDGNEVSAPVTAEVSAEHSFWPQDPNLRRAAAGGITSLLVLPGSANLIGGRGFPVKLHFGRTAAEMRFPGAKDGLKMACGENPKRVYGQNRKTAPATRMGNVAGYRQAFAQAKDYIAKQEAYLKKLEKNPDTHDAPPARDLKLETLAEVLRGNILVQNHCYRADEMAVMLQISEEFGYSIRAFHHALEAYKLRDALAKHEVATATWADWWGFKMESWDGIPENAGLITQAGARAVIHSDSPTGIQHLNQEAAKAMWRARDSGIPVSEQEALRWITLNAAWVMGVDERTGSLTPGKMADVVLWKGHPFSFYARAMRVWADGVVTYDQAHGGAVDTSDFELGEWVPAATLTASPAAHPEAARPGIAPCDAASSKDRCPTALPVTAESCVSFQNVTLLSDGQFIPAGSLRVEGGRIAEVKSSPSSPAPTGCRIIDGQGALLAPGFIDVFTQLGLVEIQQEEATNDSGPRSGGEVSMDPIHAGLRAADSINPASQLLPVARLGGLTTVGAVPLGGLVSGQSAWLTTDGQIRRGALALHVSLGEAGRNALKGTRGDVLARLRELLFDARAYGQRRADFEQRRMRELSASRLALEELQPVLLGKLPVIISARRTSDIQAALALGREFNLKLVVAGGSEAWQVASELAAAKVPVILQPAMNLPESFDSLGNRLDAAALLHSAGVKILFSTQSEPHMVRTLNQQAGTAVAWGMPYAEAVRAITSNASEAFGLDTGRLAQGATADLVLWNGDPLDAYSRPLGMWIGGKQVPLISRQQGLFEKYKALPR